MSSSRPGSASHGPTDPVPVPSELVAQDTTMKSRFFILLAAACLTLGSAKALDQSTDNPKDVKPGVYELDKSHGKITWSVSHLGLSTYVGQFADVEAKLVLEPKEPAKSTLVAKVSMGSVGTLHPVLDQVLKSPEMFHIEKFPAAEFKATRIEVVSERKARIVGDLTMVGVTKPVTMEATFNRAGFHPVDKRYTIGFDGRATIKRTEWGLKAFTPGIGDEVTLAIEGEFKRVD